MTGQRAGVNVGRHLWLLLCVGGLIGTSGCARDLGLETKNFKCATNADCIAPFVCPPALLVCVRPCQKGDDCPSGYCDLGLKICLDLPDQVDTTPDTSANDQSTPDDATTDAGETSGPKCVGTQCVANSSSCASGVRTFCQALSNGCTVEVKEQCDGACKDDKVCAKCKDDQECTGSSVQGCDAQNKNAFVCATDGDDDSCWEKKVVPCGDGCSNTKQGCCTHECATDDEVGCVEGRPYTCLPADPGNGEPCRRKLVGSPCKGSCDANSGSCTCPAGMVRVDGRSWGVIGKVFCIDAAERSIHPSSNQVVSMTKAEYVAAQIPAPLPMFNLSPADVKAQCNTLKLRLCTLDELSYTCSHSGKYTYPYGYLDAPNTGSYQPRKCDKEALPPDGTCSCHPTLDATCTKSDPKCDFLASGSLSECASTPEGNAAAVYDLVGNAWEVSQYGSSDTQTTLFGGDHRGTAKRDFSCCYNMSAPFCQSSAQEPPVNPTTLTVDVNLTIGGSKFIEYQNKPLVIGVRCCCDANDPQGCNLAQ